MSVTQLLGAIISIYRPKFAKVLAVLLQTSNYKAWRYLRRFWSTQDFNAVDTGALALTNTSRRVLLVVWLGMALQLLAGIGVIVWSIVQDIAGGWQFGAALVLSYPIVWAHLLALGVGVWWVAHPKKLGREIVCRILERQVAWLRQKHTFSVVAVAGSVGKTSTKAAIARTLAATQRVRWQDGNYNDRVTVPLVVFGHGEPGILNVFAWLRIFRANARQIRNADVPFDVVVVELGTDGPGQMAQFAYLKPDVGVLTAIAPEHLEQFGTMEAVAKEELTLLTFASKVLVNRDDVAAEYIPKNARAYGLKEAEYTVAERKTSELKGQTLTLALQNKTMEAMVPLLGEQGAKIAVAAAAAADMLKVRVSEIKQGLESIAPFPGRMQILDGQKQSVLIDDTYNASPISCKAALDVLYGAKASKRIAVLGSMNELGDYTSEAHREVGEYCDPDKLAEVIGIGEAAKKYLLPAAKKRGCKTKSFADPAKAGRYLVDALEDGAVVLAKGSQNGVFAEESLKPLLADPADASKLVRQSESWMDKKRRQFGWN